jgi:hypothetical protein
MICTKFANQVESLKTPQKPIRPNVFLKTVEELSLEELQALPQIKQTYTDELASYEEAKIFNQNCKSSVLIDFHKALAEEYGESMGTIREHYIWKAASAERNYYEIECKYMELAGVPR